MVNYQYTFIGSTHIQTQYTILSMSLEDNENYTTTHSITYSQCKSD